VNKRSKKDNYIDINFGLGHMRMTKQQFKNWDLVMKWIRTIGTLLVFAKAIGWI